VWVDRSAEGGRLCAWAVLERQLMKERSLLNPPPHPFGYK